MFKPCPNCGFLVALIAGREASQRCPRCGSALVTEAEALDLAADDTPHRRRRDAAPASREGTAAPGVPAASEASHDTSMPREAQARDGAPRATTADGLHAPSVEDPLRADSAPDTDGSKARSSEAVSPSTTAPLTAASAPASPSESPPDGAAPAHDGPSFIRRRSGAARHTGRRWPWLVALSLLAVLLALQLLLAQHVELARDPAWRPLVLRACGVLGCDVPPWHAPREYAMVARGVRPDPRRVGVLHVTATVRNDARWPQTPPIVVLSLSDVDGRLVAARAVEPRDYGHPADALVPPGDSMDIAFDVREPAGHVESFDFQLQ